MTNSVRLRSDGWWAKAPEPCYVLACALVGTNAATSDPCDRPAPGTRYGNADSDSTRAANREDYLFLLFSSVFYAQANDQGEGERVAAGLTWMMVLV